VKNLTTVLLVVLIVAVGGLYYMEFSGDKDDNQAELADSSRAPVDLSVAYVNSDTLLNHYHFFEELTNQLDSKREALEKELANRAQGLQKQFEDYKRTGQNLTIAQARAVEEDLTKKQQNLQQYQQGLTQQMMREEARITQELYDKVAAFLEVYSKQRNIQVVLTYTQGSGVLYANQALDITQDVIKGLNEEYDNGVMAVKADSVVTD
jgi:outer membrane protein